MGTKSKIIICKDCNNQIEVGEKHKKDYSVKCSKCGRYNKNKYFKLKTHCSNCGNYIDRETQVCKNCEKHSNKISKVKDEFIADKNFLNTVQLNPSKKNKKVRWILWITILLIIYLLNLRNNESDYQNLIGKPVPYEYFNNYGQYETLTGTNNNRWVVYFDKADFTMITNKKTDIVTDIKKGRKPFSNTWSK